MLQNPCVPDEPVTLKLICACGWLKLKSVIVELLKMTTGQLMLSQTALMVTFVDVGGKHLVKEKGVLWEISPSLQTSYRALYALVASVNKAKKAYVLLQPRQKQ